MDWLEHKKRLTYTREALLNTIEHRRDKGRTKSAHKERLHYMQTMLANGWVDLECIPRAKKTINHIKALIDG